MKNTLLYGKLPLKLRGIPLTLLGFAGLYLSFLVPFDWLHFFVAFLLIATGPGYFFYGLSKDKNGTKNK